ncbi:MAG: NPCBM/NEW2 domain-containing protein [Armatimonadia bacterium]
MARVPAAVLAALLIVSLATALAPPLSTAALQAAAPAAGAAWLDHKNIGAMACGYGVPHCMRSVEGKPLRLGGQTYIHGVGTHAPSTFTMETHVGARFARFVADVGVDDEVGANRSVRFEVWIDGKQAAQSPVMKSGAGAYRMDVDLTGAQQIELRVTDGGDGIKCDHADWAGAVLFAAPPPEHGIFDNFNGGLSDRWKITGTAFSRMSWQNPDLFPDQDLPWRGAIVGIEGVGFVNTTNLTDRLKATGTAVSEDFTIKLPYIRVKVGGYQLPEAAGVRLGVDGQTVRTGTGIGKKDNGFKGFHKLKHATRDVREFAGKTGHIEIYDDSAESFVMVDSIVFSSDPEPQYLDIPDVVKIDPKVQGWLEGALREDLQAVWQTGRSMLHRGARADRGAGGNGREKGGIRGAGAVGGCISDAVRIQANCSNSRCRHDRRGSDRLEHSDSRCVFRTLCQRATLTLT